MILFAKIRFAALCSRLVLIALCGTLTLAGCVTAPKPVARSQPGADATEFSGRVSVQSLDDRGQLGQWHAGFTLQIRPDAPVTTMRLSLTDPFGGMQAQVEVTANGAASLRDNRGNLTSYPTLEDLTRRVSGVAVPQSAFRYWIRGLPDPALPADKPGDNRLIQSGFLISFISRQTDGSPKVIELTRADMPQMSVRIALEAQ